MISTTVWPGSWNSRSFCSTTVWPRCRSAAVGSRPSLTRSGRPPASRSASAPRGRSSTALRARCAAVPAASGAGSSIRANASVWRFAGLVRPPDPPSRARPSRRAGNGRSGGRSRRVPTPSHERLRAHLRSRCPEGRGHPERERRRPARRSCTCRCATGAAGAATATASEPRRQVRIRKLRVLALLAGPRCARRRLDRVRDDDGRRLRPAADGGSAARQLRDPRRQRRARSAC